MYIVDGPIGMWQYHLYYTENTDKGLCCKQDDIMRRAVTSNMTDTCDHLCMTYTLNLALNLPFK